MSKNAELILNLPKVNIITDPHKFEDAHSMLVVGQIYRGLLRYSTSGEVLPDLAESWKSNSDGTKYTFKLKANKFSDDTPVTAANVVNTFARLFYSGAAMGADLSYVSGTTQFKKSKDVHDLGVRAISDSEVEFTLAHPSVLFLKQIAVVDCGILPISSFTETALPSVYSGPYKIVGKPSDKEIDVEKWRDDAFDSKKPAKTIKFIITSDSPYEMAVKGQTDSLDNDPVTEEQKSTLQKTGWSETITGLAGETFLIMNPNLISDETRKYLYSKVNQEALKELIGKNSYLPAFGLIPKDVPGELHKEDVSKLKISQARSAKGVIKLDYLTESALEQKIVKYLKSVWETKDFKVELNGLSKAERLENLFKKKSQVIVVRKGFDYPDGFSVLGYFLSGVEANYFYLNDKKVDELILQAPRILDEEKRTTHYKSTQIEILKHYTVIPLLFGTESSGLWSAKVKSVPGHPFGYHTLPLESVELN